MSLKDNRITCQCGLILKTGDEIYSHLQETKHRIKTTDYSPDQYHLIEQALEKLKMDLYSAVQMLQGEHREQFRKLIAEIATICRLEISDTGTFTKLDE